MEEQKSVQLEFRPAEGAAGETGLVIAEQQEMPERGPDGRFLEGNKAGSKKMTAAQREALEGIRSLAPKVAEKMQAMLEDKTVPAAAKIRIMEIILDRTYGKPEARLKLNVEQQSTEAARARLEAIAAKIRIEVDGDG